MTFRVSDPNIRLFAVQNKIGEHDFGLPGAVRWAAPLFAFRPVVDPLCERCSTAGIQSAVNMQPSPPRARSPKGKIELTKYHPELAAKLAKQGAIDRELADHFGVIPIARPCSRLTDPLCQGVGARPA
jgi:hypothetical protein